MAAHVPRYQTQLDQQQSLFDDIQVPGRLLRFEVIESVIAG